MRILLVEDEAHVGEYLVKGLGENGLVVDWVRSGVDAVHHGANVDYDLAILDVGLPGLDGWEVMKRLRATRPLPVLFLTARDRVEDRVRGLELGADDYLVKPFSFSELLARVRVILRRGRQQDATVLTIGDLSLDVLRRRVERAGQRIELTVKEFALLTLFLRRQTEVLSRTLIAELVWEMHFDRDTNVVEVAVRRLRAKVDEPFASSYIHTVRGFGYVMEQRA
ncbi:heavy metal response regulator transcription factor [Chitinimonas sp.]|uniref:heavy metal response regulator transcription factor n=1 Tax=Chitinimonas sp. TaxID=1934313 RepID=UPI002F946896